MKKLNLALVVITAILITVLPLVSAAPSVTLVAPADNAIISGTAILNASVSNPVGNFTCEFYAKSVSTANNTWTLVGTQGNNTATNVNMNFDSSIIEDSNDYVFNVTCYNDTDNWGSDLNTGVTVDNTVPQTPTSLSPATDTINTDGTVTFSASVVGVNTTKCILYFVEGNPGQSSYTMTNTGDTCSYQLSAIPEQTYRWYVVASDGSNVSSASSVNRVTVNIPTPGRKKGAIYEYLARTGKLKRTGLKTYSVASFLSNNIIPGVPVWLIGLIIIIAVITYLTVRKK